MTDRGGETATALDRKWAASKTGGRGKNKLKVTLDLPQLRKSGIWKSADPPRG